MASKFAGIVQIIDLDDYILPSQECIKPPQLIHKEKKLKSLNIEDGKYVQIDEMGAKTELKKATITLNDCLACSGCVTSAETVLIAQQSINELLKVSERNKSLKDLNHEDFKCIIVSCSLQSLASLSIYFDLDIPRTAICLENFFKITFGVHHFINIAYARNFSLLESGKEFVNVWNKNQDNLKLPLITSICPGWVCYAEKSLGEFVVPHMSRVKSPQQVMGSLLKDFIIHLDDKPLRKDKQSTPICDEEGNVNDNNLVVVIKKKVEQFVSNNKIYHVSVMPCYDKKLEASRSQFKHLLDSSDNDYNTGLHTDVDCVLSTVELKEYLLEQGIDFPSMYEKNLSPLNGLEKNLPDFPTNLFPTDLRNIKGDWSRFDYSHLGNGSGGYAEFVLSYAAQHIYGCESGSYPVSNLDDGSNDDTLGGDRNPPENSPYRLEIQTLKNKDFREFRFIDNTTGSILLCFAQAYGFKNIQNVIQKLKRTSPVNKFRYHYIEIMACPGGCLNGGGQIRAENKDLKNVIDRNGNIKVENTASRSERGKLLEDINAAYQNSFPIKITDPLKQVQSVSEIYSTLLNPINKDLGLSERLFYTDYHAIPKDPLLASLQIKW